MRWNEITETAYTTANVPPVVREKIIAAMIDHVVNDRYWDHHALSSHPNKNLAVSPEYAEDMADTWEVDRDGDDFPDHARAWAEARFNEVLEKINAVALVGGKYHLRRMMFVPDYVLEDSWGVLSASPNNRPIALGLYWTYDFDGWNESVGAYSIWADKTHHFGADIIIDAMVDPKSIDWETTIKANMDWFSGDREHEMRLHRGATIGVTGIEVVDAENSRKLKAGQALNVTGKSFVG